jgi:hypothetical protein
MQIEIPFGKRKFFAQIEWSERKRIAVIVQPDLLIKARVPIGTELKTIKIFLIKKAPWIAKQIYYFERFHPLPVKRCYISGETHLYLGRQYRLKIKTGENLNIKLQGQFFLAEISSKHREEKARNLMQKWYHDHALEILNKRIIKILPDFLKDGTESPQFQIQLMKKRWGSCSKNKNITLNTELVKAPIACIDYVITHELCHLLSSKHDAKFYRILSNFMPDWEKRKARLERVLI